MTLEELVTRVFADAALTGATLSKPRRKSDDVDKVTVRPVQLRDGLRYQFTYRRGTQTVDENLPAADAAHRLLALLGPQLRQGVLQTTGRDYQVLVAKDGATRILEREPSRPTTPLEHDREKARLLPEGVPHPFLVELGVMTPEGKVRAAHYDKFRQINRFVELVADVEEHLPRDRTARVVDFGSGKSYLTFALYEYLRLRRGLDVHVVGLDLKEDVVARCDALARKLGHDALEFRVGEIAGYDAPDDIDLVVSLHACDTATDDALAQAVRWQAKAIMAVPCCQHELLAQMADAGTLAPMLRHGVVKERFAALATDSLRAQLLELAGYRTQILEFVDVEHTAKNLMIRAVRDETRRARGDDAYRALRDQLGVSPALERALTPLG